MCRSNLLLPILALCSLAVNCSGCKHDSDTLRFDLTTPAPLSVKQWEAARIVFQLKNALGNPFDPREIDVSVKIQTPSGKQITHPAFFTDDCQVLVSDGHEVVRKVGESHWEARWTLTEPGTYHWKLIASNRGRTTQHEADLECIRHSGTGFVRVSETDSNYFETSDGQFFFPIGHGTRSPQYSHSKEQFAETELQYAAETTYRTLVYEKWFQRMHENGENFCSIWMTPWSLGLEWSASAPGYAGKGQYNQIHATQLDRIFQLAEEYGIYVLLYTQNHGSLSTVVDPEWAKNPHREIGQSVVVRSPSDYFSSAECATLEQHRLRYIMARWGFSRSLAGIVLCTEIEWIDPYSGQEARVDSPIRMGIAINVIPVSERKQQVGDWFRRMSRFVTESDIHQHLVSVQFAKLGNGNELWPDDEFQIVLNNCYSEDIRAQQIVEQLEKTPDGLTDGILGWSRFLSRDLAKPRLISEWGGSAHWNSKQGLESSLHVGLWAQAVSDLSGITGFWWTHVIDNSDLYKHFASVSRFTEGFDRRGRNLTSEVAEVLLKIDEFGDNPKESLYLKDAARSGLLLSDKEIVFAYIVHSDLNSVMSPTIINADDKTFPNATDRFLSIPANFVGGECIVEFWDTQTGTIKERIAELISLDPESNRKIPLIPFHSDLALKVYLNSNADSK